jgi:D-xylose transport system substrate-binding protein
VHDRLQAIKGEADAAAALAVSLAKGETVKHRPGSDGPGVEKDVPAKLLKPVAITKANVKDVVDDGFVTKAELCTGAYAALCTAAGIS